MSTVDKKTCAELVYEKMLDRSVQIEEINDIMGDIESDSEKIEEAVEELNNLALEISSFKVIKILFSTGGPSDWLEAKIDDDGELFQLSYHYADWFDHAEVNVPINSYLWDYVTTIIDTEQ
jgi:hypothetical protein